MSEISKTEIENVELEKQEEKLIGHLRVPNNGVKLFKFNKNDNTLEIVDIVRKVSFDPINNKEVFESRMNYEKNCLYMWAINKKNAIRKLKKEYGI